MSAFTTRGLILAAVAALVALAVAGCGGSSGSTSTATVSLGSSMADMTAAEGEMEGMSESEMECEVGRLRTGSDGRPDRDVDGGLERRRPRRTGAGGRQADRDDHRLRARTGQDHAEHLHGPDGTCEPKKMVSNMAVVLPDLKANSKGEATTSFEFTVHQQVVEPGYFIMVHAEGTPAAERDQIGAAPASPAFMQALSKNPGILCGDVEVKH